MDKKTKIIATIGPSSNNPVMMTRLIKKGMNVARINMAHNYDDEKTIEIINAIRIESKKNNTHIGILMDIGGPKIRISFNDSSHILKIVKGKEYTLGYDKKIDLPINLDVEFSNSQNKAASIKIDDGKISFKIIKIRKNILYLKAMNSGYVSSNKGVNFPNVKLNIPTITEKDIKDIKLGLKLNVDWIALSFVRSHNDLNSILEIYKTEKKFIPVIAKIEKPEAIKNLDNIIEKFNGVLIARGDLAVEETFAKVPVLQKNIIRSCRKLKKPVIVATQILDSMINNSIPTRAEVNDVANAVYDKVDAVMLSAETAIGEYPSESVAIMSDIIKDVETEIKSFKQKEIKIEKDLNNRSAIGESVKLIADNLDVKAIVVMSESGDTARVVSHFRPNIGIFGLSPYEKICNRMTLLWGVTPIMTIKYTSTDEMIEDVEKILFDKKIIKKNQKFIITAGIPVGVSGSTNMLQIHKCN